jgi:hypothetical protein
VERATVWNGVVSAEEAKAHLGKLSRVGVGSHSVADAGSIGHSTLAKVKRGKSQIRAKTLRRILSVDEGAAADHALAPPADVRQMKKRIKQLTAKGFRRHHLATLLGMKSYGLQVGKAKGALVVTVAAVEKLWRRVKRGEVKPPPSPLVPAGPVYDQIRELLEEGVDDERFGFHVDLEHPPRHVRRVNAEKVAALIAERERQRQERDDVELAELRLHYASARNAAE